MTHRIIDWTDISYLRNGSPRQRQAYGTLTTLGVFTTLAAYTPVLVGTIPIDIDIPGSDLDIVCEVYDRDVFEQVLRAHYGRETGFTVEQKTKLGVPSVVCDFSYGGFQFQIFGQARPSTEQNAYRHMIAEARLLEKGGEEARKAIRALKMDGLKTEPAFAAYFGLEGDPYQALLDFSA